MPLQQSIIDVIDNPLILKNEHGVVLNCNQAFLRFRNISASKIIGFTAHDFLSPQEAAHHTQADQALLNSLSGFIEYDYQQNDINLSAPPRNVSKSIIHEPKEEARKILVVIGLQATKPNAFAASMHLTQRENSVLRLLVQGKSQKQIAQALMISHHTVADHCKIIYQKLGVNSRTQAQLMAITKLGIAP